MKTIITWIGITVFVLTISTWQLLYSSFIFDDPNRHSFPMNPSENHSLPIPSNLFESKDDSLQNKTKSMLLTLEAKSLLASWYVDPSASENMNEASTLLSDAIKLDPDNATALILKADLDERYGRYKEAEKNCRKAAKLLPKNIDQTDRIMAKVHFMYGDDEKCRSTLKEVDTPTPSDLQLLSIINVEGMKRTQSKKGHYLVYTDKGLSTKKGDLFAANALDLIYKTYTKVFPFKIDKDVVYRCFLFSSRSGYERFANKIGINIPFGMSLGFYSPNARILVICADPDGETANEFGFTEEVIDTLFHEGFHQFLHIYLPYVPLWFNEALAEYFGPSQAISSSKIKIGTFKLEGPAGRLSRFQLVKGCLEGNIVDDSNRRISLKPLSRFLQLSDLEFRTDNPGLNYAQGWSFIHYLLESKLMKSSGKKIIKNYFNLIRTGENGSVAFQKTFGKLRISRVEESWKKYVLNDLRKFGR